MKIKDIGKESEWYHYTYIYDYITLLIIGIISLCIYLNIIDTNQYLSESEIEAYKATPILNMEQKTPIFSMTLTFLVCYIPNMIVVLVIFIKRKYDFHDAHSASLGLVSAVAIIYIIQAPLAKFSLQPRPNWGSSSGVENVPRGFGYVSFPSGHTSVAFCTMVYLSMYIHGKMRIFEKRRIGAGQLHKIIIGFLPLVLAFSIGVARIRTHNHHPVDVLAGATLGTVVAYMMYITHFPYLTDKSCHQARNRKTGE